MHVKYIEVERLSRGHYACPLPIRPQYSVGYEVPCAEIVHSLKKGLVTDSEGILLSCSHDLLLYGGIPL